VPALLSPESLADALRIRDLTDPREGPHALQLLVDAAMTSLADTWPCEVRISRSRPIVPVEDNYERLRYSPDAVTRDARYTRYVSETCVLRSHTSALIPPALRTLAVNPAGDVLLACPGLVYRRDSIDRLHSATPHQLDLWRVTQQRRLGDDDLHAMVDLVLGATLPDRAWRWTPAQHPYTTSGRQIDVWYEGDWVEVGECGLAAQAVLSEAGLDAGTTSGLALGVGLDRLLMIRKGLPDIRLLRSTDPRVSDQLCDLSPWRPVSRHPPVLRDISVAVSSGSTGEEIGDRVREALGPDSDAIEDVTVLEHTSYDELPPTAVDRLGLEPHQENVLVRIVLRDLHRTLTAAEANDLRDRIWAAIDEGFSHASTTRR
jgi:phenylalanyl-tRNA synthetase alpha chain